MAWSIFQEGGGDDAALAWADDLLKEIGAPESAGNKQFVYDWETSEGGGGAYNPLNQGPVPGDPGLTTTGQQYGGGAADFAGWKAGLQGASDYLHMPAYSGILTSLAGNDPEGARSALIASPWAASHYGPPGEPGANFSDAPLPDGQPSPLPTGPITGGGPVKVTGGPFGGLGDLGSSLASIADTFTRAEKAVEWFLVPSHWVRIFSGVFGTGLVAWGLWSISRTGRSYSASIPAVGSVPVPEGGQLAPAIGIASVTTGSVLLFVAFHNLPSDVSSFPAFIGYLQHQVKTGGGGGSATKVSGAPVLTT